MSAGDIVTGVVFWNSDVFNSNPIETQNQKINLLNHMKGQVKNLYDLLSVVSCQIHSICQIHNIQYLFISCQIHSLN